MEITNGELLNNAKSELSLQSNDDLDKINLVYPINQKYSTIFRANSGATTSNTTLYTTDSRRTFYLCGVSVGLTKDVTSDNVGVLVSAFIGGSARRIIDLNTQTTTAQTIFKSRDFTYPIPIDSGTAITLVGTFTAGTLIKDAQINGFYL